MGHIGLGDDLNIRRNQVKHRPEELHNAMGIRQMDAGGARLFPDISDCIQSDEFCTVGHKGQQDFCNIDQHSRVVIIQIHLVLAERRPHL